MGPVIDSRKKRKAGQQTAAEATPEPGPSQVTSLFVEEKSARSKAAAARAHNRLTAAQLKELEAEKEKEVSKGFKRLRELWPLLFKPGEADAEREWMVEAEKLVDMFKETRNLFLTSRVSTCIALRPRRLSPSRPTHSAECYREPGNASSQSRQRQMKTE